MTAVVVPVLFDERQIEHDLTRLAPTARIALEDVRREVIRYGGLPTTRLRSCDAHGRDGTELPDCFKTYVPWGENKWGLVLTVAAHPTRLFALRAFAYGVRHPTGTTPSVYEIAHRRLDAGGRAATQTIDEG